MIPFCCLVQVQYWVIRSWLASACVKTWKLASSLSLYNGMQTDRDGKSEVTSNIRKVRQNLRIPVVREDTVIIILPAADHPSTTSHIPRLFLFLHVCISCCCCCCRPSLVLILRHPPLVLVGEPALTTFYPNAVLPLLTASRKFNIPSTRRVGGNRDNEELLSVFSPFPLFPKERRDAERFLDIIRCVIPPWRRSQKTGGEETHRGTHTYWVPYTPDTRLSEACSLHSHSGPRAPAHQHTPIAHDPRSLPHSTSQPCSSEGRRRTCP